MSSIIEMIEILTNRLPELEYRLDEIGKIWCFELPRGLFRSSQYAEWMSALACVEEVHADLVHLKGLLMTVSDQTSPAVLYRTQQMSLKMQVLLQLCQQYRRKKTTPMKTSIHMKQLVTRQQWLDTIFQDRDRLLLQQSALTLALEQNKETPHAALAAQHALSDVKGQLSSLQQMLSTLTGVI